jgi:RNA polymerase sigma-70 factor, ECF subfamily
LLLLQHARRDARERYGRLITLADQDRSLWRQDPIRTGTKLVSATPVSTGYAEELRLQGLIAAEHAGSAKASDTHWPTIATLYARLETLTGSPVVRLNRAVAVGESQGPQAGLDIIEGLDHALANNHRLHAVRADLAQRAGKTRLARTSYQIALELCTNEVEQQYLTQRLAALDPSHP